MPEEARAGPWVPPVGLGLSHILEPGAKGSCGCSGQGGEMGEGRFIWRLTLIRGYLSRGPWADCQHCRLCLSAPCPRTCMGRGSVARQVWETPCAGHDWRRQSRYLEEEAQSLLLCTDGPAQFMDNTPLCVLPASGRGAPASAAVADGCPCWAQDEPGTGPGVRPLLPVPHPLVDQ